MQTKSGQRRPPVAQKGKVAGLELRHLRPKDKVKTAQNKVQSNIGRALYLSMSRTKVSSNLYLSLRTSHASRLLDMSLSHESCSLLLHDTCFSILKGLNSTVKTTIVDSVSPVPVIERLLNNLLMTLVYHHVCFVAENCLKHSHNTHLIPSLLISSCSFQVKAEISDIHLKLHIWSSFTEQIDASIA